MRTLPYLLLLLLTLTACSAHYADEEESQLVVEGWIDEGDFPIVILTRSIPVKNEYQDISDLSQFVEHWARVTISDGEQEVTLVGQASRNYFPPYYYTTSYMRGEAGKTYRLRIHCTDGTDYEALTTIPLKRPVIDSFSVERTAASDTLYQLYAHLDPQQDIPYYKLFTQTDPTRQSLRSSLLGVFTADMVENHRVAVNAGRTNLVEEVSPFFSINDTVRVKLSAVSEEQYVFWRDFEYIASLSRNPFFPTNTNLSSNVPGCLGYWFGYASSFYVVPVRDLVP